MMTKKIYQLFANALGMMSNNEERELIMHYLFPVFHSDNFRFDEERFKEWVRRVIAGEDLKGLR